jgi:hypothetical protein
LNSVAMMKAVLEKGLVCRKTGPDRGVQLGFKKRSAGRDRALENMKWRTRAWRLLELHWRKVCKQREGVGAHLDIRWSMHCIPLHSPTRLRHERRAERSFLGLGANENEAKVTSCQMWLSASRYCGLWTTIDFGMIRQAGMGRYMCKAIY